LAPDGIGQDRNLTLFPHSLGGNRKFDPRGVSRSAALLDHPVGVSSPYAQPTAVKRGRA